MADAVKKEVVPPHQPEVLTQEEAQKKRGNNANTAKRNLDSYDPDKARVVSVGGQEATCPVCKRSTLKMKMNRKVGQRVYCSSPDCNYDTAHSRSGVEVVGRTTNVNVVSRGVTIKSPHGS
jgi:hypothetical protein